MTFNYAEEEVVHGHEREELDILEPVRSNWEPSMWPYELKNLF